MVRRSSARLDYALGMIPPVRPLSFGWKLSGKSTQKDQARGLLQRAVNLYSINQSDSIHNFGQRFPVGGGIFAIFFKCGQQILRGACDHVLGQHSALPSHNCMAWSHQVHPSYPFVGQAMPRSSKEKRKLPRSARRSSSKEIKTNQSFSILWEENNDAVCALGDS